MRLAAVAAVVLLGVLVSTTPAAAGCARGLVADGRFLEAAGAPDAPAPPTGGNVPVILPGCNDSNGGQLETDEKAEALRVEGVPPGVAVVRGELFVAPESLRVIAGHPLPVRMRRRPRCRDERVSLRGEVAHAWRSGIDLLVNRRPRTVLVDGRTRLTNRPAYQPFDEGQKLAITATRACDGKPVAEEIAFVGGTVPAARYEPYFGRGLSSLKLTPAAVLLVLAAVALTGAALHWSLRRP